MRYKTFFFIGALIYSFVGSTFAQDTALIPDTEVFEKARVLEVMEKEMAPIPGTDTPLPSQTVQVEVLEGKDVGKIVTIVNDYTQVEKGDIVYLRHQSNHLDGSSYWSINDPYRLDTLLWLTCIFVLLIFMFGGIQGVRGLASLIGSIFLIFYVLVPGIYSGGNAVLISIGVSSLIIVLGSYITHGFNRTTSSAVLGMIVTVIITGLLAYYVVDHAKLSGYASEESTYLTLDTRGAISMVGLLFGGIMIGLLGVLYDIAIGQAVAVEELFRAGKSITRREVYRRAIRIGKEHIGALVNTLAIAYVGTALPLILLIQSSTTSILFKINSEIFATEIVRILIGSIGLIIAVPITTLIASYMLEGRTVDQKIFSHVHRH
jgi:uncharacterized membrane protein